jgi:hypothetical protein
MASEERLGGSLLWMVVAAAVLLATGLTGFIFAFDRLRELGGRYTIAIGFITAWSLAFIVLTVLRVRATPTLASAGLVLWIAYRFAVAASEGLLAHWPLAVDLLAELAMAASFCGYMAGAVRPNAYYRRRLPAP